MKSSGSSTACSNRSSTSWKSSICSICSSTGSICYLLVSDGPTQSSSPAVASEEPGIQLPWRQAWAATSLWACWVNWEGWCLWAESWAQRAWWETWEGSPASPRRPGWQQTGCERSGRPEEEEDGVTGWRNSDWRWRWGEWSENTLPLSSTSPHSSDS